MYLYLYLQCVLFSGVCTFVSWHFVIAINVRRPSSQRKPASEPAPNTRGVTHPSLCSPRHSPLFTLLVLTHATHCIILDWHYFWGHSGEMPVLNTTKLVSFLSAFSYFLLRCVANFRRGAGQQRDASLMCLTLPMACPSVNAFASYSYVYAWLSMCMSLSVGLPLYVCVCQRTCRRAAYVTLLAFNLSYRYFFLFICVFCQ